MTAKLFRTSMAVAVSVMVLSIALFMGMLYQYFSDQMMTELESETWLVSHGVELDGMDYLNGLHTTSRVTWVAADGTVLYDNEADASTMENHADREEIREALTSETGTAQRFSSTLSEQTLYVTQRLSDGTVIRLASAQKTVGLLLISMIQPILIILVLSLLLSAVLASRLSKGLIKPILSLDLEHPEDCETYDELTPLLSRLKRQNDTIQQQMNLLKQRQTEFAALTDNMSEGFLLLDRQGHVLSHNSGALRLLGVEEPEGEVNVLVLNREEPFRQAVDEALSGKRSQQMLHLNGRYCKLLANPVLADGKPAGAVLVLLDVTEQEQRDELRREFTANVSHELKTPLTSISGIAEIMQSGMVKPEDIQSFAGDIYQEAQRLIALVEDIIRLSRLDEGAESLEREPVNLLSIAQDVARRLDSAAQKAGVTLKVMGLSVEVRGIPSVLDEMVYNLCDNAIKYNHPGGTVNVTVAPTDDGSAEVTVEDTGIGIPVEDQSRVFERFYRVDKSHSKEIGGTGLGLSIVKHGASLHGAQIHMDSQVGRGTSVQLLFPHHE
ncbi:ATP-binding protein [Pseudoflavonifractor sp. An184]|uniref:sensor histidine kinase n=1 Tax=Pseudoflavonifractor sp. An184 TaxID=1965576 RepID=UPI000B37F70F|nr:ATP-binding protein [Pseudoflavonifractor sp. An184]OUP49322.1 histidine kinase [Pseudoflavonifractor sp. An184]